ncbi:MAG: hydroxyacid dehydrogenase [Clostridia bacterium]|nr:hydroxyacid dehydrogenase [Clostridia bacterium]
MRIVILDSATLGSDISFESFKRFGEVAVYERTAPDEVEQRILDCDVVILNKIKLGAANLSRAGRLKLICVTATGFDNIDTGYCRLRGIAVCNVKGYSTDIVAQLTVSMALSLVCHLGEYDRYVKDGRYTASGVHNRLEPVFHELTGLTWGIAGYGAIGRRVAEIARALGCKVIAFKREPVQDAECVSLDELCRHSDILSVHLPLTDATFGILDKRRIEKIKPGAIVINVSRGAVADEAALAAAVKNGVIGGLGIDVYSVEPIQPENPLTSLFGMENVLFTPHIAWGAYESRVRCMREVELNIDAFLSDEIRNRVEI